MTETFYRVGVIVNTQGLDGTVRVLPTTDFASERFAKKATLALFDASDKFVSTLTVTRAKAVKNLWHVKFDGFDTLNAVEKFKNFTLKISAENLGALPDGEFYYHEILGLDVYENDVKIGVIREILQPGANDVWVVARDGKKDLLLPYIPSVVLAVNLAEKRVEIEIPEGLDD
ncbi:MAG: ribosome maturation factor RimM [Streptococcaceae bacterium]|jgi:16S rRNA processing protein RimM|nr:ribosome maturation factor RimM [Streptococcaceae bacterium]